MVYDDLIIGSGLTALAVAYGLGERNRVCVLAGPTPPQLQWYDQTSQIPCAHNGLGGLGAFWHGVIPFGQPSAFFDTDLKQFEELFRRFYPQPIESRLGQPWLFVPYRPIRPAQHWKKLYMDRKGLVIHQMRAERIDRCDGIWTASVGKQQYRAHRIWLAAGALGTPALLENSPGLAGAGRSHVSDHAIIYLGQLDRRRHQQVLPPKIERNASGVWMLGSYDGSRNGLISTKPARFSYAKLDYGIEQRSAFGLPTSGLVTKVIRAGSLGLVSESLFNKFGFFPDAKRLSAYAQIRISDAYQMQVGTCALRPDLPTIQKTIQNFRNALDWPELECSEKPELFIRGIHLHNSLDLMLLMKKGMACDANFTIVDPSVIVDIGPEHHSFKAMVKAYSLAKLTQS